MENQYPELDKDRIPKHIAIIMDGNGRWAKSKGKPRVFGHQSGVHSVRSVSEASAKIGIEHLTLYAFSTENWNRPKLEVNALMALLVETIKKEVKTLNDNNIRLNAIGNISQLPNASQKALLKAIEDTAHNTRMTMHLALNYSSRWEIVNAVKHLAEDVENGLLKAADVKEATFVKYLATSDIPDPELLIRTSGELRISNYLLWQIAYSELYFTDVHCSDFREHHLVEAIKDYQARERRFGKISEQVNV